MTEKMGTEKASVEQREILSPTQTNDYDEFDSEKGGRIDYSGAHDKTDPKEIALVKKLDWYIMPTLWGKQSPVLDPSLALLGAIPSGLVL
jgi:hypothetical protein